MGMLQQLVASAASVALLAGLPGTATAQAKYPSKGIEVVVPFAPGGGTDNLMRMITGIMEENKWSPVPLNVNNRPGGSGTIGYSYLINKKGDSHVVAGATPMIVSGKLQGRLPGNHRDAITVLMIVAIDELMLDIAPVLLGSGERLFDDVPDQALEPVEVIHSPFATHIRYRVGESA